MRSIRAKLTVNFVLLSVIPLLIIGMGFSYFAEDIILNQHKEVFQGIARDTANQLDRFMYERIGDMQMLATNEIMHDYFASIQKDESYEEILSKVKDGQPVDKIQNFIAESRRVNNYFATLEVLDMDGVVVADTFGVEQLGVNKSDKAWFENSKGGIYIKDVHLSSGAGGQVTMDLAMPIFDYDGKRIQRIGVVMARLDMDNLWEITDSVKLGKTGKVTLYNQSGQLIADADRGNILGKEFTAIKSVKAVLQGKRGVAIEQSVDNTENIVAYRPLPGYKSYKGLSWSIQVSQHTEEALMPIVHLREIMLLLIAGIGLATIGLGLLSGRRIASPLVEMAVIARKFADQDWHDQIKIKSKDEIGVLGSALNQMASKIRNSIQAMKENERMSHELNLAASIQKDFLPQKIEKIKGLDIATHLQPATEVGGDLYDVLPLEKEKNSYLLYVADVSGHGLTSGIMMAVTSSIAHACSRHFTDTKKIILELNRILQKKIRKGMFVTMVALKYMAETGKLSLSGAGHERIILARADGTIEFVKTGGLALALLPDLAESEVGEQELQLNPGDSLVIFTDGVTEAKSADETERYGEKRLEAVVKKSIDGNAQKIQQNIVADLQAFSGERPYDDDVTVMVIKKQ